MSKTILVTGGAGFIGSHLIESLLESYDSLFVLDNLEKCSSINNLFSKVKFVHGNVNDIDIVMNVLKLNNIDTIFHLAAETNVDESFGNSLLFTQSNIYGTHVLLECCRQIGTIKKFIHMSTDEVYGEAEIENNEESVLNPTNPYAATKAAAEFIVKSYYKSFGIPVIIVRCNNVYGPRQYPDKIIPRFFLRLKKDKSLPIHGKGTNIRSYIYITDVIEALHTILIKGKIGEIYNIKSNYEITNLELAKKLSIIAHKPLNIKFIEDRPFNDRRYMVNGDKLKELGWDQEISIDKGLKLTYNWYMNYDYDYWKTKYLIWGSSGWIGSKIVKLLERFPIIKAVSRIENYDDVEKELLTYKPTRVILVAGLTGRPNIDWCEDHKTETVVVNICGILNVISLCEKMNIHVTYFGTGCIYEYDKFHSIDGKGFCELDKPNYIESIYSFTKSIVEDVIKKCDYKNVLVLRIRMPISDDFHPRNFITKILKYDKVINMPNSMSVLYDLLPISIKMMQRRIVGIYNFTNPGAISHNEILEMYKKYIDSKFTWNIFSVEEQNKILRTSRSNNKLDTNKLCDLFEIDNIKLAVKKVFERIVNKNINYQQYISDNHKDSR